MHAFRTTTQTVRMPGPIGRLVAILMLLGLLAVGIIIAIPVLLVGAAVGIVLLAVLKVRLALRGASGRDPQRDERENVRVIGRGRDF